MHVADIYLANRKPDLTDGPDRKSRTRRNPHERDRTMTHRDAVYEGQALVIRGELELVTDARVSPIGVATVDEIAVDVEGTEYSLTSGEIHEAECRVVEIWRRRQPKGGKL